MKKLYDEKDSTLMDPTVFVEQAGQPPEISVFLPVYDEEPNLVLLHEKLDIALRALGRPAEIIYVDDGSSDQHGRPTPGQLSRVAVTPSALPATIGKRGVLSLGSRRIVRAGGGTVLPLYFVRRVRS